MNRHNQIRFLGVNFVSFQKTKFIVTSGKKHFTNKDNIEANYNTG